jgi:phosphate starvation-inducible PhoH-like protein
MRFNKKKDKRRTQETVYETTEQVGLKPKFNPVQGMTENQKKAIKAIKNNIITFLTGFAGTGKSYLAVGVALEMLFDNDIDRIVITRPVCETGRDMGALPNGLDEKFAPFIAPIIDIFNKQIGASHTRNLIRNGKIEIRPLEYMRGTTFDNCVVICDESANTTTEQAKMLLTRIGKLL